MTMTLSQTNDMHDIARINGVAINVPQELITFEDLRQRGMTELLRQAAMDAGLLATDDEPTADGVISEAAADAIDLLLESTVIVPDPAEEDCRRHYDAHQNTYAVGESVWARHILFAVTPGLDVAALRKQAETILLDIRCHDGSDGQDFAEAAAKFSNCPSGANGGDLGWLSAGDCAPEFSRELFGQTEVGVLPRLVLTRFGMHVVEVLGRKPGTIQSYESVHGAVVSSLRQQAFITALQQYLQTLASKAVMENIALDMTDTPLIQ